MSSSKGSDGHTLAVTVDGQVYSWGDGESDAFWYFQCFTSIDLAYIPLKLNRMYPEGIAFFLGKQAVVSQVGAQKKEESS